MASDFSVPRLPILADLGDPTHIDAAGSGASMDDVRGSPTHRALSLNIRRMIGYSFKARRNAM